MTLPEIANDIAQVFGQPTYGVAPAPVQARILIDINKAIQELQDSGEDFFGREDLSVTLVQAQEIYTLPKNVQTLLAPVELSDKTILSEICDRGALLNFASIFLGGLVKTIPIGKPSHYFLEALKDTGDSTGDSVRMDLHILPTPDSGNAGAGKLILHVIREPTAATAGQLASGSNVLSIPNKYVESIFLPLARWNATGSYIFYAKDKKPQIDADYERALKLLNRVDPRRPQPGDSNDTALETGGQKVA